ncbi:MAG TPA: sugar phosphate nucleotidyltransferase [Candidatus Bathyarchaeia archaeon]|nr:sugar phosphate nucleotidyltransferase [Candidatus Bathyarchaeia archaeon]
MNNFCGLILCAGYGSRLQEVEKKLPKPMITINKKTLIEYIIDNFIKNNITKIIFVIGYKKPVLLNFLKKKNKEYLTHNKEIKFFYVLNNAIERENGFSGFLGLKKISDLNFNSKIVLSMGDHLYSQKFIKTLVETEDKADIIIGTDSFIKTQKIVEGSTTKILGENGEVIAIGKDIKAFNRIDTGIFLVSNSILKVAEEVEQKQNRFGWTDIIKLAMEKKFAVNFVDFDDIPWFNINYKHDLLEATEFTKKWLFDEKI